MHIISSSSVISSGFFFSHTRSSIFSVIAVATPDFLRHRDGYYAVAGAFGDSNGPCFENLERLAGRLLEHGAADARMRWMGVAKACDVKQSDTRILCGK